jgi:hypothetical protein
MRAGSVRSRVAAPIRCRPTVGCWPLTPAIEVRILAPERAAVAKRQGTRLQSAQRGFDSRPMLRSLGALAVPRKRRRAANAEKAVSIPAGGTSWGSASVRGRDPSLRSSVSWFESSQRHNARVVQRSGRRSFKAQARVRFPSRARKVRSAWCRHRSRKPGGAKASGFDSYAFHVWKIDLAEARAPFAKRMDPSRIAVRLRHLPRVPRASCLRSCKLSTQVVGERRRQVLAALTFTCAAAAAGPRPATRQDVVEPKAG